MGEFNLAIFDIDGTLTQTCTSDTAIYADVVANYLNITGIDTDWNNYSFSTDLGLLTEIFANYQQREPTIKEINLIQTQFTETLGFQFATDPTLCQPLPGATEIFSYIKELGNWHVGIATGSWRLPAMLKLETAQISHDCIPTSSCDDHIQRTGIIQKTIERCLQFYGITNYLRIIYIGDGLWDKKAADELQIEFIGIGQLFSNHGRGITDYTDKNLALIRAILCDST